MEKYSLVPIFVPHLGCPNDCVFCNQRAISGETRQMTAEDALEILQEVDGKIKEVAFYGGSFTAICESLQNELLDVALKFTDNIRISTRPDAINQQILDRLKLKKVKTIELGAQSMCDEVLFASKRGHISEDIVNASELIRQNGFVLGLQMMVGLPNDTYETLIQTTRKICELKPDIVRIYPVVVIEQTELYDMYKNGQYKPLTVERAVELCVDVLEIFNENSINVIRVGLNPTEDLSNSKAVAGAYHEALGQMVSSAIYYKKMLELIGDARDCEIIFGVHKSEISTAVGQKRYNKLKLYNEYRIKAKFIEADVEKGEIVLV
ncbi:MAG: radical SAM protein [Clostridia bacterium]